MDDTQWRTHRLELDDQTLREWDAQVLAASSVLWHVAIVAAMVCAVGVAISIGGERLPQLVSDELNFASLSRFVAAITLITSLA